jgi:transcriptional regulator with XRE-family HTH domain
MSRKQKYRPLSSNDYAICERVRDARLFSRASQSNFASAIGLSRDQLASVELGRVALRFATGLSLCRVMNLNPLWLAFGETQFQTWFVPYEFAPMAPTDSFSEVMTRYREQYRKAVEAELRRMREQPYLLGKSPLWDQLLLLWNVRLSDLDSETLRRHVRSLATAYLLVKNSLTMFPGGADSVLSMKASPYATSRWKRLQRRLQAATRKRGQKAALARDLRIKHRQVVTAWLKHSTRGPSAEATLRLLEWIEKFERDQSREKKRAGSAETRPALKTRKSKSSKNEKAKSSQRKQ